ncbi:MAG TPA: hypothetical protein VFV05_25170 [Methylomirabilota bacterium]|nr:hypothetical protein [Methylomirabilota bacterium]
MPEPAARAELRQALRALLVESAPELSGELDDDTPLLSSGLVESTTLLDVALWVEDRIDAEVDLGALDLVTAWDSVRAILDFVERHRPAPAFRGPATA